ncbi:aldo/keto reductase [Thalassospira xiamenensis]|uniref:aldo/keto reductase n=1 Tax=Thalassospira xiamenensis TaxID=220697 RepID=UPI003AA88E17
MNANSQRNRIALGTVQFGMPYGISNTSGKVPFSEVERMLDFASEKGVNTLDTAIGYGDSEKVLGRAGVGTFQIVSKLPPIPKREADVKSWVKRQIDQSLSNLNLDHIYALLLHRPDDLFGENGKDIALALTEIKSEGIIRKLGVSIYSPDNFNELSEKIDIDLVQCPFNIMDRRMLLNNWDLNLKKLNIEIHTRSVFLQGLLLMPKSAIPRKFDKWVPILEKWHNWLEKYGQLPTQTCLALALSTSSIDRVLIGATNLNQLEENLKFAELSSSISYPDLACTDEDLINPSRWETI